MVEEKIEEFKKDIAELEHFEQIATRQRIKDILSIEIRRLVSEVVKLEELRTKAAGVSSSATATNPNLSNKRYEVKLNNYAWDQTDKFVKFYVTLNKVNSVPADNIKCTFTTKSLELTVKDLDGKDYALKINNLLHPISPEDSTWKVKTDMVIINAAKQKSPTWSHVTEYEKKASDQKAPKMDENIDPSEGLMSLMRNMYEKGDDEMKRTIAKAWTESQSKGPAF